MGKILFISTPSYLPYPYAIMRALIRNQYTIYEPEYYDRDDLENHKKVQKQQNEKYIEAVLQNDIDFVIIINHAYADREFFDVCKMKNLKVFLYTMDSVRWCDYAVDYLSDYAGIYSFEPTDCGNSLLPADIEYLPIGYDEESLYPETSNTYEYDICFVGMLDKRRIKLLSYVADYAKQNNKRMIVYTDIQLKHFRGITTIGKILSRRIRFKIKYKNLYKVIQNKPILGQDLRKLYNGSKICLNINQGTRNPEWHTGVNPRTFEIMGCNSFELIDAGHLDFVDIVAGRDIIEFSGKEDLVKKIDYYLSHDDERKSIAANGYKIVKEKYTSSAIVKTLLHKIESILE